MKVQSKVFTSTSKSGEGMCEEVSEFASEVGKDRLINISVAASGGQHIGGLAAQGVIVVWYWE